MSPETLPYYRAKLRDELTRRIDQNSRYSLRSFAKALGIEASALSQILRGKRFISDKMIERLLKGIELSPSEQSEFTRSVALARKAKGLVRSGQKFREALNRSPEPTDSDPATRDLTLDQFRVVSDWYHTAILEMTHLPKFRNDPRWISRRLGISTIEAKHAVQRLLELELLENADGRLIKTEARTNTLDKTKTSAWHRRRQKQVLEKSIASLENDPIEKRVHSAITFAIDPKKVQGARERIQKFIWEMNEYLTSDPPQTVYEMTVNLFPIDLGEKP